jgi:hypothetical protein
MLIVVSAASEQDVMVPEGGAHFKTAQVPSDEEVEVEDGVKELHDPKGSSHDDGVYDWKDTELTRNGQYKLGESRRRIGGGFKPVKGPWDSPPIKGWKAYKHHPVLNKEKLKAVRVKGIQSHRGDILGRSKDIKAQNSATHFVKIKAGPPPNPKLTKEQRKKYLSWAESDIKDKKGFNGDARKGTKKGTSKKKNKQKGGGEAIQTKRKNEKKTNEAKLLKDMKVDAARDAAAKQENQKQEKKSEKKDKKTQVKTSKTRKPADQLA